MGNCCELNSKRPLINKTKTKHDKVEEKIDKITNQNTPISTQPMLNADIFKSNDRNCFAESGEKVLIQNCHHLNRLISGLKYYQSMNTSHNQTFVQFVNEYKNILNDYTHFIDIHSNDLEHIHNQLMNDKDFGECALNKCLVFKRHFDENRRGITDNNKIRDERIYFYSNLFDNIHHYLFHLYETGMRTKESEIKENNNNIDQDEKDKYKCIDYEFLKRRKIIENKRNKFGLNINRYNNTNNKFNLKIQSNDDKNDDKETFVDSLFECSQTKAIPIETQKKLYQFIKDEQFDSEALMEDIYQNGYDSNIANHINDIKYINFLKKYIEECKSSSFSFSNGIIWFYWQWYKNRDIIPQILPGNINDYGGYDCKELFVERKYENYKQEILKHINIKNYQKLVLFKANEYMTSDKVKAIKANDYDMILHYGIEGGEGLTMHHIMSLILYCDFSEFCTSFSSSFRKISGHESLSSIKKRNQEFWWQSKLFRETIEIYGTQGINEEDNPKGENGPFYVGVDRVLVVSSFCIRLCSPTSTSKDIEVSMNFATLDGMVIQLNNNGHALADVLPFFDCSSLSCYGEENERVFCGGWMTIRIETIRIMENSRNFELFLHALFILDSMVSGTMFEDKDRCDLNITESDVDIINKLINPNISSSLLDPYVISTFKSFVKNKKQITINMYSLDLFYDKHQMNELVTESGLKKSKTNDINENILKSPYNLLSNTVFKVFKNVERINIATEGEDKEHSYAFNLLAFLNIITSFSSWTEIKIQQTFFIEEEEDYASWINSVWWLSSTKIQAAFNERQLQIIKTTNTNDWGDGDSLIEECLMIERSGA